MFKQSRRKIVAAIMSILVLLWVGTLGVIYTSSYLEMKQQNKQMLQTHAQMYKLPQFSGNTMPPEKPKPEEKPQRKPGVDPNSPMFQLSTFYTVAVSKSGEILETNGFKISSTKTNGWDFWWGSFWSLPEPKTRHSGWSISI